MLRSAGQNPQPTAPVKNGTDVRSPSSRTKGEAGLPIYAVTQNDGLVRRDSLDRQIGVDAGADKNLRAAKDDLVYNMMRMWQGAVGKAPEECMVSPAYIVLSARKGVNSQFFLYMFNRERALYLLWAYKQVFKHSVINPEECGRVNVEPDERQNRLQFGDVIFTTSSETPKEVGYASVFLSDASDVFLNSFCFAFRPKRSTKLLPEFSQYLFRSEPVRKKVEMLAQGITRFNMSKTSLMKLSVSFPDENEQRAIATFCTFLDEKIDAVNGQLQKMQDFKEGLLQQMYV